MPQLTRYDSYEALKADTNRTVADEQEVIERHLEMKQVMEYLRNKYLDQKEKQLKTFQPEGTDE